MKAAIYDRYGSPDVIGIREITDPKPGLDEVLIRMHAVSVNPVDWKVVKGNLKMFTGNKFPKYVGIEGTGIIEETGAGVTCLQKGQRVFVGLDYRGGACAEIVCTHAGKVIPLDDSLGFEEASTMAIAGMTALQGLRDKGKIKPGMSVLINGATGGVGTYAVQIAKVFGADITAVCSKTGFELVKNLGAAELIDYRTEDFTRKNKKYDIILDTIGNLSFCKVKRVMKKKAVYVNISPNIRLFLISFITKLLPGKKLKTFRLNPDMKDLREVMKLIVNKKIKVIIDRIYPFEETAKAFQYSSTERAKGKIIIKIK
jgi:NADPH:quinone reductase-like Zn-dependent oxidoreductase